MARRRFTVCGSIVALLFLSCALVMGEEFRDSEVEVEVNTNLIPVQGRKNAFRFANGTEIELFAEPEGFIQYANGTRRKLGEFLACAPCKCCDATRTFCAPRLPCCYSINCNVQPFGLCKFYPITCNCYNCGY